jgi:hypothetical protein
MSGLCSWFGRERQAEPAVVLKRMEQAPPGYGPPPGYGAIQSGAASGPNFGLAIRSHLATSSFAVESDSLTNLKRRGYFRAKFLDELIGRARAGTLSGHETVARDLVVLDLWLASRA